MSRPESRQLIGPRLHLSPASGDEKRALRACTPCSGKLPNYQYQMIEAISSTARALQKQPKTNRGKTRQIKTNQDKSNQIDASPPTSEVVQMPLSSLLLYLPYRKTVVPGPISTEVCACRLSSSRSTKYRTKYCTGVGAWLSPQQSMLLIVLRTPACFNAGQESRPHRQLVELEAAKHSQY
jgi:hypothetical protein